MVPALLLTALISHQTPAQLQWDPRVDIPVTAVLATGWITSEILKKELAPPTCRWCATNGFDTAVRQVFNPSLTPSSDGFGAAHVASNMVGFIAVPVGLFGLDALLAWRAGALKDTFLVDALLVLETTMSAMAINQLVKFTVGRGRPYTVGATEEITAGGHDIADNQLSFFSGHSTFTFALVCATATIADLRGYRHAWTIWAVGLPLAASTAILRLGADKHWTTDVLIGSAVGTLAGVLMPRFLHGRVGTVTAKVAPVGSGLGLVGQF